MSCDREPECPREVETPEEENDMVSDHGVSPGGESDREVVFNHRPRGPPMRGYGGPGYGHQADMVGMPVRMSPEPYDGTGDWEEYQAYFEQLAFMHGWDKATMAMVLGVSLRGAARSVLTGFTLGQRRDYGSLIRALKQNFSPAQKVHTYLAELKCRKRKPHETLSSLGRDIARLVRLAYPQADQATKETIGINALMDALPGPAIETRLHVLRGQPGTLQEAIAFAMEVDSVIESSGSKGPVRRGVNQVDSEKPGRNGKSELKQMAEALHKLEAKVEALSKGSRDQAMQKLEAKVEALSKGSQEQRFRKRDLSDVTCFNCGEKGHYKRDCKMPLKKQGNGVGRQDLQ